MHYLMEQANAQTQLNSTHFYFQYLAHLETTNLLFHK